jgi:mono/diheme cytochrome c family protein
MRIGSILRWSAVVLLGVGLAVVAAVYLISERKLQAVYPVPASRVGVPQDPAAAARGEHLVRAVGTCTLCHGEDLGGLVYADMGSMGRIVGPNLTRGRGGAGATFTVEDWVRAIRYGVRRDGTSLIVMPSEVYTNMTDADLGAIIAFLLRTPPVDREMPASAFGPIGRALLAVGRLSILVAPKTHHAGRGVEVRAEASVDYGRYLADISGCHGCHGHGLSGGKVAGPPGLPLAANLTPTGLGSWTDTDFMRAMRKGVRPDGRQLDEFMPWRQYSAMTDAELRALWMYLQSVLPKATGNK